MTDEIERLRKAYMKSNDEICQTLGKALGYPWFKDDQANFPGADEENGVCVGDHVAESIAVEAAARIRELEAENAELRKKNHELLIRWSNEQIITAAPQQIETAFNNGKSVQAFRLHELEAEVARLREANRDAFLRERDAADDAWNAAIEAAAHKATWGGWDGEASPADAIRKLKRETKE